MKEDENGFLMLADIVGNYIALIENSCQIIERISIPEFL